MSAAQHAAAMRALAGIQAALGGDEAWDAVAEGSGFYALQSCANHSCRPAARAFKSPDDFDGAAVLVAERRIEAGEEVQCFNSSRVHFPSLFRVFFNECSPDGFALERVPACVLPLCR